MQPIRSSFFVLAAALLALAVAAEAGAALAGLLKANIALPGSGISYLVLVDALLLLVICNLLTGNIAPGRIWGRIHGAVALLVSLLVLIAAFMAAIKAFVLLMIEIGLFLAPPFGTAVYLTVWGVFDVAGAAVTLGVLLLLKCGFAAALFTAQPDFYRGKSLVTLILISLGLTAVLQFVQGLVPNFLVNIVDMLMALVIAIVAIVFAILCVVFAIIQIVKAIRSVLNEAKALRDVTR